MLAALLYQNICLHLYLFLEFEEQNNEVQYSEGRGAGGSLKFAVKVPNFVMPSLASG